MDKKLQEIINYIVDESIQLKDKYTDETDVPVEFVCIFCQNNEEYGELTDIIKKLGKVVQDTPSGYTYLLNKPINTAVGPLKLVKIRKPDPERKERGDSDFNTSYKEFKGKYQQDTHFEVIQRENFEMLRLSDPEFDVMVCFSSIPLSQEVESGP